MSSKMLLNAALILVYLSLACEAQTARKPREEGVIGRHLRKESSIQLPGGTEGLPLAWQSDWMQEGGGRLRPSGHEAKEEAVLSFLGGNHVSANTEGWIRKEEVAVKGSLGSGTGKGSVDGSSRDASSSRPDAHAWEEGTSEGGLGWRASRPDGNGGSLSSMQLEGRDRFVNSSIHTAGAILGVEEGKAGRRGQGATGAVVHRSDALHVDGTESTARRHILDAKGSTDSEGSGHLESVELSTFWHLGPSVEGHPQWTRLPNLPRDLRSGPSSSGDSLPSLSFAQRMQARLQRARVLAGQLTKDTDNRGFPSRIPSFRHSKLETFGPGSAPAAVTALGALSPSPNGALNSAPGPAPNPAPASAPASLPSPARAPSPASLPPPPACPNITISGLNPSAERKTAYSDTLALAAIKLVSSNMTAMKSWRGDDPCNDEWSRVLCELQSDGLFHVVQLDLSYMALGGIIIPGICQLTELRYLALAGNNLSGSIPPSLGAMPKLEVLHLYDNNLSGSLPPELGLLSRLEELRAETNGLNGTIPEALGALQNLVLLSLFGNRLTGPVPPSLGSSQNLMVMRLYDNRLNGTLPLQLTDLSNLQELDLSFNMLTGQVWPYMLGKLNRLQILKLTNNNLTGPLDNSVGDMRALQTLDLSYNKLQGPIPSRLSELHNLQYVSLANNEISGPIPKELGYNNNINYLLFSNNTLNGSLPDALGNIVNLMELCLDGNEFVGPLPSGLGNLAQLRKLHLENNQFTGGVPDTFSGLPYLQELWLDNNMLSDPINPNLAQCTSLSVLSMTNNNLTGPLPNQLGGLSSLVSLGLANNSLMGPIPLTYGSLRGLRTMYLENNRLNGTIPPTLGQLTFLQQLWLQNNDLEGAIPPQLGNLKNVDLRLDGNPDMCGPFFPNPCPSPPGVAPSPSPQCPICPPASGVQAWTGSCNCVDALTLQLKFGTRTPFDSARLELLSLSLANGLGVQRQQIDLVGNVTYNGTNAFITLNVLPLGNLSLSEGQIRGMVRGLKARTVALPESVQDVSKYDVVGVDLPPGISLSEPGPSAALIAGSVLGAVAALLVILCALSMLLYMRLKQSREKRTSLKEGGSFDGSIESDDQGGERRRFSTFLLRCLAMAPCKGVARGMMKGGDAERAAREMDYWELRRATNNFGKSRLIGEGGFGRVYRAKMDDGSVLAVKRLNEKSSQGESEFWAEVSTLGRLAHPNLVKLVGYCSHRGERLVAYEYMLKGSLKDYLHGYGSQKAVLDWSMRMRIAVGAAEGLAFLHAAIPSVIHRDFKSSNILLDGDLSAKVADFGLAREGPSEPVTHVSTQVRGTLGYSAPEYVMSGRLTTKSDVYSFGVVLLELITGRTCVDPLQPPGMEYLVDWAKPKLGVTEKLLKVVDPDIASRVPLDQLHRLSSVAASCLRSKPHDRPSMVAVLDYLLPLIMSPLPSPRAELLEPLPYSPPLSHDQGSSHQYRIGPEDPGNENGRLSRTQSWGSAESFETAEVGSPWHKRFSFSFGPRLVVSDSSVQDKERERMRELQKAPEGSQHRSY